MEQKRMHVQSAGKRPTRSAAARKRARRLKKAKTYSNVSLGFVCLFLLLLICLIATFIVQRKGQLQQENIKKLYYGAAQSGVFSALFPVAYAEEEAEEPAVAERFQALCEVNPDIIGWLRAGDAVDTPVVFNGDNSYYLDHDLYGDYDAGGTVFADQVNENWMTDPLVLIYGHSMNNGTMFGRLKMYADIEYLHANPLVTFDTIYGEKATQYVPFAIFSASMLENNDAYFDLRRYWAYEEMDQEAIQRFLDEAIWRSVLQIPVEVTTEDRILVLVTCSYDTKDGRFMVFCRELRADETPEGISAQMMQSTDK